MKQIVGYVLMSIGLLIVERWFGIQFWSRDTAVIIAAFILFGVGSGILDSARRGLWPWEERP